jgi:ABC-type oligopeptide transport system substrate-binding subunit
MAVKGVDKYLYEDASFDEVGVSASEDGKVFTITLEKAESFFPTRLVYSCFMPLNDQFFKSKGGAYGAEYKAAQAAGTYKYGQTSDLSSILYNGPFILTDFSSESKVVIEKNPSYFDAANVTIEKASWIYDDGSNPLQVYADVVGGVYPGMSLSAANGTLAKAKEDGIFDTYKYVTETNATTYFAGFNVNRGTYVLENGACESPQTEEQKIATHNAMMNKNFRKALQHAFDRKTWNAVSRGEDLAETNIRNMYTAPNFVATKENVAVEVTLPGKEAQVVNVPQGIDYGDIVQEFYNELGTWNRFDTLADGVDGFHYIQNEEAKALGVNPTKIYYGQFLQEYVAQHGKFEGICLDLVYYSASSSQVAQANQFKKNLEAELPGVKVNLVEATTTADYYAVGYRAKTGTDNGQDVFYGSGWGPDFADPSSYLETFLSNGYMTKVCGLNKF